MKIFRPILILCIFLLPLFFCACSGSESQAEEYRVITITIRNQESDRDVHIYFGTDEVNQDNFIARNSSIQSEILAKATGHTFNVYVEDAANLEDIPLLTTNVTVTDTSWNARVAELHWTGAELQPVGW